MKPLTLIPVPENESQCRSIHVKCNKGKTICVIWDDRTITPMLPEDFALDVIEDFVFICKNFTLFYNNIKTQ